MRRILSERNLIVVLFVITLVFFVFAQQDVPKIEKMYQGQENADVSLLPLQQQPISDAGSATATEQPEQSPVIVR